MSIVRFFWGCSLLGGHSGIDIIKNRKNAIKVLGELLYQLNESVGIHVASISAGGRLNVITPTAEAVIVFDADNETEADTIISGFNSEFSKECAAAEPDAFVSAVSVPAPKECADTDGTKKMIFALMQAPNGVLAMNADIPDLVQTSSNPGEAVFDGAEFSLSFMLRSNSDADKTRLITSIKSLIEYLGGVFELGDNYPAWEYRPESAMRYVMAAVYEEMYGEKPIITAIHAGLECGILSEKLPGADMVSIGPTMKNVHTPEERLDIKSTARVWEYLLRVLKMLK